MTRIEIYDEKRRFVRVDYNLGLFTPLMYIEPTYLAFRKSFSKQRYLMGFDDENLLLKYWKKNNCHQEIIMFCKWQKEGRASIEDKLK